MDISRDKLARLYITKPEQDYERKPQKTNYIKAKIGFTQQNSKCWLYRDRDETVNHILNEYNRLVEKEAPLGAERWSSGNCARN